MWELVGVGSPSLDHNEPCDSFQHQRHSAQQDDHSAVSPSPFIVGAQDFEAFEHIDDAHDDHAVSHGVMVNVPVDSVLMILLRPQKQSEYLNTSQHEQSNPNVTMGVVLNCCRLAAEFDSGGPPGNSHGVGGGLAGHVKVKPGWICRLEHLQIPCENGSHWHQSPPADRIQHSVNLRIQIPIGC